MASDEVEAFPAAPGFSDDDIPVIGDHMLHPDVQFESGMSPVPVVSLLITAACIFAFGCQIAQGSLADLNGLRRTGALDPAKVREGEIWRLVSSMFLHANFDHILGNMVMLYILGIGCEHAFGRLQFLTLYVVSGACGSVFSLADGRVSLGASGAIFGLAGALFTSLWWHRRKLHVRDARIGLVVVVWAVYQFVIGFMIPQVNILAHFGGFLAGCVMGIVLEPAVLVGRAEVNERVGTRVEFLLASTALAATAFYFVPRLVE